MSEKKDKKKKASTNIVWAMIAKLVVCVVLLVGLGVLYYFGVRHFVSAEQTVKQEIVNVNCSCNCAENSDCGCNCAGNGDCNCTNCNNCVQNEVVAKPTLNITAIVCVTAAYIVLTVCLTVVIVKAICYYKYNNDKTDEKEITDMLKETYTEIFKDKK